MKSKSALLVAVFLTTLITMSSCSRLDLAVNLANSYITNKADNFFDLTGEQKKWLKAVLERDIDKVKKTIFPQLASEMFKAASVLSEGRAVDYTLVYTTYKRLENLFYQTLRIFSPSAVAFSDKLSPNQLSHFQKEFDGKIKDLKEDPEDKTYEKMKKQFDSWAGSISSKQKKEIKSFANINPSPVNEIAYSRQTMAYQFVRLDKNSRKAYVEKLFTNFESARGESYSKIVEDHNKKVVSFVTGMLNKMPQDQKKSLVDIIRDRANQLIKISRG